MRTPLVGVVVAVAAGLLALPGAAALAGRESASAAHRYVVAAFADNDDGPARVELVRAGGAVKLVARGGSIMDASWAADGSSIAWRDTFEYGLFVARPDGRGKRFLPGDAFAWSPVGHRLVVSGVAGGKPVEIIDAATGHVRDATPHGGGTVLQWLPSGLILYSRSDSADPRGRTLVVAREDGSGVRALGSLYADWYDWAVSPDGRILRICGGNACTFTDIASGRRTRLGKVSTFWSPDGRYGYTVLQSNGRMRVMTVGADGHDARNLVTLKPGERLELGQGSAMVLGSPDGKRLALGVFRGDAGRVLTVGVDGRGVRTLYSGGFSGWQWLPDGTLTLEIHRKLIETRDAPHAGWRPLYLAHTGYSIWSFQGH